MSKYTAFGFSLSPSEDNLMFSYENDDVMIILSNRRVSWLAIIFFKAWDVQFNRFVSCDEGCTGHDALRELETSVGSFMHENTYFGGFQ